MTFEALKAPKAARGAAIEGTTIQGIPNAPIMGVRADPFKARNALQTLG
jgi:hypothetical protein